MIKILIGGSPCTFWSIAQKNNRETEAEGLGWELFKNYLIAKEKFKPDFFLYENNKSAAQAIKDQISRELGVDLMYINSALVSAQNRQRFYAFNWTVEQPEDRGFLLRDILESGTAWLDKSYTVDSNYWKTSGQYSPERQSQRRAMVAEEVSAEPFGETGGKAYALTASYWKGQPHEKILAKSQRSHVIEPVGVGFRNRREEDGKLYRRFETHGEEKANALTTVQTDSMVAEPIYIGEVPEHKGAYRNGKQASQQYRVYSIDGKSVACDQDSRKYIAEAACVYSTPCEWDEQGKPIKAVSFADEKVHTVYEVCDGRITIKDKEYRIKLADGFYIIRKLTPVECERLQTMPDGYTAAVSSTQRYKGLGNGWTAEVIIHILNGALKDVPRDEEIVVLSMYDGIGTGRYCLDKMGFTNVRYYAYEIDKYVKQVAMSNYPDIIQMGNAFDLRHPDWTIGY